MWYSSLGMAPRIPGTLEYSIGLNRAVGGGGLGGVFGGGKTDLLFFLVVNILEKEKESCSDRMTPDRPSRIHRVKRVQGSLKKTVKAFILRQNVSINVAEGHVVHVSSGMQTCGKQLKGLKVKIKNLRNDPGLRRCWIVYRIVNCAVLGYWKHHSD